MHDELVDELKSLIPAGNFTTQCLFQPLPTLFAQRSVSRGGNMLGLDKVKDNALLWLITGSTQTTEQDAITRNHPFKSFQFGQIAASGVSRLPAINLDTRLRRITPATSAC
jgi:hypothetical protein